MTAEAAIEWLESDERLRAEPAQARFFDTPAAMVGPSQTGIDATLLHTDGPHVAFAEHWAKTGTTPPARVAS